MDLKEMARRFNEAAKASGKTNEQIGGRIGVSGESVRKWRNGDQKPRWEKVDLYAKETGVSSDWLVVGYEKPSGPPVKSGNRSVHLAPRHLGLIEAYIDLPPELRMPIRMLIEATAIMHNSNYQKKYKPRVKKKRAPRKRRAG